MSALAMVLAAAMAVPGNWPDNVSGEMKQGLDLREEWEGIWIDDEGIIRSAKLSLSEARLDGDKLKGQRDAAESVTICFRTVKDQGAGRLRFGRDNLGIYQRDGGRLLISFRDARQGFPVSFRGGDDQNLLILHRVKPGK